MTKNRKLAKKGVFPRPSSIPWTTNAYIITPGGVGTTLELMMVWQLLQVRKLYDTPVLLVGKMWWKNDSE